MTAIVDKDKCNGVAACVGVCPVEAISLYDNKAVIDADLCIDCGACVSECPNDAISL